MAEYKDFFDSILPGNYALTKSMEITKTQSSGTLWYMKKFLILYYYVFLSNDIMTRTYINKVAASFDLFIDSIDENIKNDAYAFFYPVKESINFHSDNFISFSSFASQQEFNNQNEKKTYYQNAKKCYFASLMDAGGQTGVKKKLKEAIQSHNFKYSELEVNKVIFEATKHTCIENCHINKRITDNSIKYILSDKVIKEINKFAEYNEVTSQFIDDCVNKYPLENPRYRSIENDMVAFIRNERQIMYYYGYFHSKSSGATDFEFSSLTPIGDLALEANYAEFLALWEHQKIKMISQPPTAEINNVPAIDNLDKFAISFTPYTDILGFVLRNGHLSLDKYQYIVSRRTHNISENEWTETESSIVSRLSEIQEKIFNFDRLRDLKDEDARKELLKYLLGIRSDLHFDNGTNLLNIVEFKAGKVSAVCPKHLRSLYTLYNKLNDYKVKKYSDLFLECESDLRTRYIASASRTHPDVNARIKIDWDLYNIHVDKFILVSVMLEISALNEKVFDFTSLSDAQQTRLSQKMFKAFEKILKRLGILSQRNLKDTISNVVTALKSSNYSVFLDETEDKQQVFANYRTTSSSDLLLRISEISSKAFVGFSENRERNNTLIGLLKYYYISMFSENDNIKCECCGDNMFITDRGEPYIELHHLIPFKLAYGPDHYLNLFALCPNCHRKLHYIKPSLKEICYKELNKNNYLKISLKDRLCRLKAENLLRSYHLEFLLADKAITQSEYNIIATTAFSEDLF